MEFSAMLVIKEEWIVKTFRIELPDGKAIKLLQEDKSINILGYKREISV